jgi:hypothetical protein
VANAASMVDFPELFSPTSIVRGFMGIMCLPTKHLTFFNIKSMETSFAEETLST